MMRFKRLVIGTLAAAMVSIGSIASPASASAAPMTCATAQVLADIYSVTSLAFRGLGQLSLASYWVGRATGLTESACG